ncbi:MAG TPA: hypothetical protein VFJ61_04845 [Solirubrobacterales bacterium]|nr:hypothetical protein [Solirubrobacterales bacterium]
MIVLSEKASDTRRPALPSNNSSATFSDPAKLTVFDSPGENLPVHPTLEVEIPFGGMNKSGPMLDPSGVLTETLPPRVLLGTLNLSVLTEADVGSARTWLSVRLLATALGSKCVPEIVISSPPAAKVGEIDEMLGANDSVTVKVSELVTGPSSGVTTLTVPVVAPLGTLTVSEVAVAALTLAVVPLNLTVLEEGVDEKPVPSMVTIEPICAREGLS